MTESEAVTRDPVCGMTVDAATALHEERDGKSFSFCSEACRQKFLSAPANAKREDKSSCGADENKSCCG
jgi:Cu+-exporting ATPase